MSDPLPAGKASAVLDWLAGLRARGAWAELRPSGRLSICPVNAYKQLTDEEILFLRHHRADIKEALRVAPYAGLPVAEGEAGHAEPMKPTSALALRCVTCGDSLDQCIAWKSFDARRWEIVHRVDPAIASDIENREAASKTHENAAEFAQVLRSIGRTYD